MGHRAQATTDYSKQYVIKPARRVGSTKALPGWAPMSAVQRLTVTENKPGPALAAAWRRRKG